MSPDSSPSTNVACWIPAASMAYDYKMIMNTLLLEHFPEMEALS